MPRLILRPEFAETSSAMIQISHKVAGLIVSLCLLAQFLAACTPESGVDPEFEKQIKKVCDGGSLPNAAGYTPGEAIHPMVIFLAYEKQSIPVAEYPQGWLAKGITDLQLVACAEETWRSVETCKYNGTSTTLERQRQWVVVNLVAAKTGALLGQSPSIPGETPDACPKQIREPGFIDNKKGSPVKYPLIVTEVKGLLNAK